MSQTTQANFRFPLETIEFLDHLAGTLAKKQGFRITRTQALLHIISIYRANASEVP